MLPWKKPTPQPNVSTQPTWVQPTRDAQQPAIPSALSGSSNGLELVPASTTLPAELVPTSLVPSIAAAPTTHAIVPVSPPLPSTRGPQMNICVTKPNGSGYWPIRTDPLTTAGACIEGLVQQGGLRTGGDYRLFYQGREILPQESFQQAGLHEGGTVVMQEIQHGA